MTGILYDLRYMFRTARTNAVTFVIVILTLGVGFGGNAAIFSIVDAVLLRPLPYDRSDQLVNISESFPQGIGQVSYPNFNDWRTQSHSFQNLVAYRISSSNLQTGTMPMHVSVLESLGDLFGTLRVRPLLGRTFSSAEDAPDGPNVVVLSSSIWKTAFGEDKSAIGRKVTLGSKAYEVIGIMRPEFEFGQGVWIPLHPDKDTVTQRGNHGLNVMGRLRDGASLGSARAEMDTIARRLAQQYADVQTGRGVQLQPMNETISGPVRPRMLILFWSVGFVLMIACANVMALQMTKASKYRHETDLRIALGARPYRIFQQFLVEAVTLALAGALLGLMIAYVGLRFLLSSSLLHLPRIAEIGINSRICLALFLTSTLCGILIGLAPALQFTFRAAASGKMLVPKANSRMTSRTRKVLVVAELAATYTLVVIATLLAKTLWMLQHVDSGLSPENVLTMQISASGTSYQTSNISTALLQPILQNIQSLPGVQAAGLITMLPLQDWGMNGNFEIPGRPAPPPGAEPFAEIRMISAGYHQAMGVRLLRGRFFSDQDTATSAPVAIINDVLADRYFPGEDPIGKEVNIDKPATIVGVVRANIQSRLADKPLPEVDRPYLQFPDLLTAVDISIVVRSHVNEASLLPGLRNAVREVDSAQSIFRVSTMNDVIAESLSDEKSNSVLLAVFGIGALLLSVAGLFGLMMHNVTQHTREIGIRMALGASRSNILRWVLWHAGLLLTTGIGIGIVGSLISGRFLQTMLFGVTPASISILAGVAIALAVTGLSAAYLPARRAAAIEPTAALRQQ